MKVLKITCADTTTCHEQAALSNPNMVSMLHHPNNHILIMKADYTDKGHVKKSAWKISEENKLDSKYREDFKKIAKHEFV